MKSSCPKRRVNASTAPDFCRGSVVQQRISGGGECEGPAFLNSLHAHIRRGTKGASAIGPQLWGEVFSPGARGPKSPIWSEPIVIVVSVEKNSTKSQLFTN